LVDVLGGIADCGRGGVGCDEGEGGEEDGQVNAVEEVKSTAGPQVKACELDSRSATKAREVES
jgi:hypothetical protein